MQRGKMLVEGPPDILRQQLEGRVLELRGEPISLLRRLARSIEDVEDAQMFGDRVHLRVREGKAKQVMERLETHVPASGGLITHLEIIPSQLEDLFIALLEQKPHA